MYGNDTYVQVGRVLPVFECVMKHVLGYQPLHRVLGEQLQYWEQQWISVGNTHVACKPWVNGLNPKKLTDGDRKDIWP